MLHWRIILGSLFVFVLVALAWLDFDSSWLLGGTWPGVIMAPLAVLGTIGCAGELVRLFEQDPNTPAPSRYVVVTGALVTVLISCVPMLWGDDRSPGPVASTIGSIGWVAVGLAVASSASFTVELLRFRTPGSATLRLALAIFGIAYAGGLMGFVIHLRLLAGGPWGDDGRWGMFALLSMLVVVKMNDIGAYFTGRFWGRTKMAPLLSPKKTWEGIAGGFALSAVMTMLFLGPIASACGLHTDQTLGRWFLGCLFYSIMVGIAGVSGDLAVSLLKRDAGLKNSSTWMPGFGGVLDLLDSILYAAPVAYLLWIVRCVGP